MPSGCTRYSFGRSFSPTTNTSKTSPGPTVVLCTGAGKFFGAGGRLLKQPAPSNTTQRSHMTRSMRGTLMRTSAVQRNQRTPRYAWKRFQAMS